MNFVYKQIFSIARYAGRSNYGWIESEKIGLYADDMYTKNRASLRDDMFVIPKWQMTVGFVWEDDLRIDMRRSDLFLILYRLIIGETIVSIWPRFVLIWGMIFFSIWRIPGFLALLLSIEMTVIFPLIFIRFFHRSGAHFSIWKSYEKDRWFLQRKSLKNDSLTAKNIETLLISKR